MEENKLVAKRPYRVFAAEKSLQKRFAQQAQTTIDAAQQVINTATPELVVSDQTIPLLVEAVNSLRDDIARMTGTFSVQTVAGAAGSAQADGAPGASGPADGNPQEDDEDLAGVADGDARMLRREIASMIRSLAAAKREIAEIKHPMGGDDRMKRATLELDAIVGATEDATEQILEATESINAGVDTIRTFASGCAEILGSVDLIENDVTRIMEACTFQDITGQRITRVIRTFEFIEDRLRTIIETLGVDSFTEIQASSPDVVINSGDELVNGPQLEGSALSQDDIDALFG